MEKQKFDFAKLEINQKASRPWTIALSMISTYLHRFLLGLLHLQTKLKGGGGWSVGGGGNLHPPLEVAPGNPAINGGSILGRISSKTVCQLILQKGI